MKASLALVIAIVAFDVPAAPSLRPGMPLSTAVQLDSRTIGGEPPPSIQYMSGLVACEMAPPGRDTEPICPAFAVVSSVAERLEIPSDLGEPSPAAGSFSLDSQRKLRYGPAGIQLELDISRFFLPGTVVRHQWPIATATSDAFFLLTETCNEIQGCRDGLWFFAIDRQTDYRSSWLDVRPSVVALPYRVDWRRLETESGFGPRNLGDRRLVVLPLQGGPAPVAVWAASFKEHPSNGILELLYEVYPLSGSIPGKEREPAPVH